LRLLTFQLVSMLVPLAGARRLQQLLQCMFIHMCVGNVHARVEASDRPSAIRFSAVGHFVGCVTALDTHTGCVSMLRFFRVLPCIHTWSAAAAEAACSRRNISQYPLSGGPARPSVWGQV
jgi:hypothetical protein